MANIPRLAAAGVYGVVVEGMKFYKGKKGMAQLHFSSSSRYSGSATSLPFVLTTNGYLVSANSLRQS